MVQKLSHVITFLWNISFTSEKNQAHEVQVLQTTFPYATSSDWLSTTSFDQINVTIITNMQYLSHIWKPTEYIVLKYV